MYSKPQQKRNTLQSSRPFHGAFFDDDSCKVPCKSKPQHFHFGCLNIIILEFLLIWIPCCQVFQASHQLVSLLC